MMREYYVFFTDESSLVMTLRFLYVDYRRDSRFRAAAILCRCLPPA